MYDETGRWLDNDEFQEDGDYILNYHRALAANARAFEMQALAIEQQVRQQRKKVNKQRSVDNRATVAKILLTGAVVGMIVANVIIMAAQALVETNERLISLQQFWAIAAGVCSIALLAMEAHCLRTHGRLSAEQRQLDLLMARRDQACRTAEGNRMEMVEIEQTFPWLFIVRRPSKIRQ